MKLIVRDEGEELWFSQDFSSGCRGCTAARKISWSVPNIVLQETSKKQGKSARNIPVTLEKVELSHLTPGCWTVSYHSVSGNGVKQGHMHTLAHILNVVPKGGKELEELSGNACSEKAILDEDLQKKRQGVLKSQHASRLPPGTHFQRAWGPMFSPSWHPVSFSPEIKVRVTSGHLPNG